MESLANRLSASQQNLWSDVAIQSADLELRRGEINALLGQNGAGKSTLVKILAGVVAADEGSVLLGGTPGVSA